DDFTARAGNETRVAIANDRVTDLPMRITRPAPEAAESPVNLSITLEQPDKKLALFGSADRYLRMIRDAFGVQLVSRDDELKISGESAQVTKAAAVLEQMQKKLRRQDWLSNEDVGDAIGKASNELRERQEGEIEV